MILNQTDEIFLTQTDDMILNQTDVTEFPQTTSPIYYTNTTLKPQTYSASGGPTWMTLQIIVISSAVLGNSLTMCICLKKINRKKSFMLYLAALAFFDMLNILGVLLSMLNDIQSFDWGSPKAYCKLNTLFAESASYISSWIVVALSFERTVSTKLPHHVAKISGQRFGIKTILTIVAVSFICNTHTLYGWTGYTDDNVAVWCDIIPGTYRILWTYYHPYVQAIFFSLIPGILIILCNFVMVKAVFASVKIRGTISDQAAKRNRELMIIAVLVSVSFIILTSPYPLFIAFSGFYHRTDIRVTDGEVLVYRITRLMSYTNNAINFFLYVISGRRFRQHLREMLPCKRCHSN